MSASTVVATEITENADDMVEEGKSVLVIIVITTFWMKRRIIFPKMILSGSKQKLNMERKSTVNSLHLKQRGS